MEMEWTKWLEALCLAPGLGDRQEASQCAAELLAPFCERVERDPLGNVIGWRAGDENLPLLLLEAHIDQIGFVVTGADEHGFLRVAPCGGVDNRILTANEVVVYGDRAYPGVFCSVPPHLGGGDMPAVTARGVDVGMTAEEVKEHIPVGSFAVYRPRYTPLLADQVAATSLDDRCGVVAVLRALQLLDGEQLPCRVAALFSVQEELGMRGASPAAFALSPEAALSCDVSFADGPQEDPDECGELSCGPMIGISPTLDAAFCDQLVALAEEKDIYYQREVMGGTTGTNADRIGTVRGGVRTALLSVPLRYMHTPVEVVELNDIERTAQLMAEFARHWRDAAC